MGKFLHSSLKAHYIFPIHGLAVVVKKKFHHSWLRHSWWNFFSPRLLSHSWGKYNVPFVIHGKISFSPVMATPLRGKNPIPIPPNYGIKPFRFGNELTKLRPKYAK